MKTNELFQDDSEAPVNRFEILFILIHLIIVLPPVRALLTEPRSLGLGITSLLFVMGLWMMRGVVKTTRVEFLENFEDSENSVFGVWTLLAFYLGAPIIGALVGGFGLISLITGTIHLTKGTPLMDIGLSDWIIGPNLIVTFGVALLMWGVHLQPQRVKALAAAQDPDSPPGYSGVFRKFFIEIVIAIQANRFFFLLLDSLPKSESGEWIMNAILLAMVSTVFFLPLQLLVWRLRNRPVSRWDVWKLLFLFTFVSLSFHLAPDGWVTLIREWF